MLRRRNFKLEQSLQSKSTVTEEQFINFCKETLGENMATFFEMQLKLAKSKGKGLRYPEMYKQFALTVYFLGGKAVYRFLQKQWQLPSKATLCRITKKWQITSGVNDFVFKVISLKVDALTVASKECVLCADEMSLKTFMFYNRSRDVITGFHETNGSRRYTPANSVLVLMARGIHSRWKQPIAYFFVENSCPVEDMKIIIFQAIQKLQSIALNVRALITDQGPNFQKLSNMLGISEEQFYFEIDDKKVYYLFDTPHLLKSTRNNFLVHQFKIDEGLTSKEHLITLYNLDKGKSFRFMHKITDMHLNPTSFKKMKVSLAAQLLSNSVATSLMMGIASGHLPQSATTTATFIENMDKLFDMLNSYKFGTKEFQRPFMGSAEQLSFLNKMIALFQTVQIFDVNGRNVTKSMRFVKGWIITINGIKCLYNDVRTTKHILFTRRLNQDCLENYFGSIRQQSGNNLNPTPTQFGYAFKKLFFLKYFQHSSEGNCLQDIDSILTHFRQNDVDLLVEPPVEEENMLHGVLSIDHKDYIDMEVPEQNALSWVAGYFVKKCLDKHNCLTCVSYAKTTKMLEEDTLLSYFRAYKNKNQDLYGNLKTPPTAFYSYIKKLDVTFCDLFPKIAVEAQVGQNIKKELEKIPFTPPCTEFPMNYLLNLFTRVRIFYTLKFLNRNFRNKARKNQKIVNLTHM